MTNHVLSVAVCLLLAETAHAQYRITREATLSGTLVSVAENRLEVRDAAGRLHELRIQSPGATSVPLKEGGLLRFSADVEVRGEIAVDALERGQAVRLRTRLNRRGETDGVVDRLSLAGDADADNPIKPDEPPADAKAFVEAEVVGPFQRLSKGRLVVRLARNDFTRKKSLTVALADNCLVASVSDDYRTAAPGARVTEARVADLNTGDRVIRRLRIAVSADSTAEETLDDALEKKYRRYSDQPVAPRLIRSRHFLFQSDLSDREAKVLLDKLETMVGLLSDYFGRKPSGLTQGYIVRDLSKWPDGLLTEPAGVAKIREGAGICFSRRSGKRVTATVYSAADHGVVQHECTHAYCNLAFGSTGPTWLAEGVAEMGQYWRSGETAVKLPAGVLRYLRGAEPKKTLAEIATPGRVNAGDYRDYAWRWALCHLLANNPNYAPRFKPLAIGLMTDEPGVSFASVYGPVNERLTFEYDLFLQQLDNGYESRLTGWQWDSKFAEPTAKRPARSKIAARAGWQASGARVSGGQRYAVRASGEWRLSPQDKPLSAAGDAEGRGRLVGVVMREGALSEPFDVGAAESFAPSATGELYLRCRDAWGAFADNEGELSVAIIPAE